MAHLISYSPQLCFSCKKPAVCILRNNKNAIIGYFCKRHGAIRLKEVQAIEDRETVRS